MLQHLISSSRDLFTFYRALPTVEAPLHLLSKTLFLSNDYVPQMHDTPLAAYEEMGRVLEVAKTGYVALKAKVDEQRHEMNVLRGAFSLSSHWMKVRVLRSFFRAGNSATLPSAPNPLSLSPSSPLATTSSSSAVAAQNFPTFLNFPLSTTNTTNTPSPSHPTNTNPASIPPPPPPSSALPPIMDYGVWDQAASWDQSDLLVSLGLVQPDPVLSSSSSAAAGGAGGLLGGMGWGAAAMRGVGGGGYLDATGMAGGGEAYGAGGMYGNQAQSTDLLTRWLDRGSLGGGIGSSGAGGGGGQGQMDLGGGTGGTT